METSAPCTCDVDVQEVGCSAKRVQISAQIARVTRDVTAVERYLKATTARTPTVDEVLAWFGD